MHNTHRRWTVSHTTKTNHCLKAHPIVHDKWNRCLLWTLCPTNFWFQKHKIDPNKDCCCSLHSPWYQSTTPETKRTTNYGGQWHPNGIATHTQFPASPCTSWQITKVKKVRITIYFLKIFKKKTLTQTFLLFHAVDFAHTPTQPPRYESIPPTASSRDPPCPTVWKLDRTLMRVDKIYVMLSLRIDSH